MSNLLIKPYDGFRPAIPQYAAGRRVEPPVSVHKALKDKFHEIQFSCTQRLSYTSQRPAATAAALPPELPPADRCS